MVKVGQKVTPGDHICDIETDKATIAWEAQEEGYIAKMLVEDGASDVPVGKVVLIVCDDVADVAAVSPLLKIVLESKGLILQSGCGM